MVRASMRRASLHRAHMRRAMVHGCAAPGWARPRASCVVHAYLSACIRAHARLHGGLSGSASEAGRCARSREPSRVSAGCSLRNIDREPGSPSRTARDARQHALLKRVSLRRERLLARAPMVRASMRRASLDRAHMRRAMVHGCAAPGWARTCFLCCARVPLRLYPRSHALARRPFWKCERSRALRALA